MNFIRKINLTRWVQVINDAHEITFFVPSANLTLSSLFSQTRSLNRLKFKGLAASKVGLTCFGGHCSWPSDKLDTY